MKLFISVGTIVLIILATIYSVYTSPNQNPGYIAGRTLGVLLAPATPAVVVALVHYLIIRNKLVKSKIPVETIDSNEEDPLRKTIRTYWFYVLFYTILFGFLFASIISLPLLGFTGR